MGKFWLLTILIVERNGVVFMQSNGSFLREIRGWMLIGLMLIAGWCYGEWVTVGSTANNEAVSATVLRSDENGTDFTLSVSGIQIDGITLNGETFSKLTIPGEWNTWQVGYPDLPKVVKLVAIPATGNVELHVEAGEFTVVNGVNVPPVQEEDLMDVAAAGDALEFNGDCYRADAFYPDNLAEISEPVVARDFRLVAVTMYPVQYNPVTQQLRMYSDLSVSVEHTGGQGVNEKQVSERRLSRGMMPFYRHEVLNFDELDLQDPGAGFGTILIICYNNSTVLTEANKIAKWKQKKGYNVEVVTTSVTGTSASNIYNYIYNMYHNPNQDPPLEYVMIVGDASGSYSVAAASSISDYGYSLLEGGDYIAEIAIGRLSFNLINDLRAIRKKLIKYESNPYMGGSNPNWFQDAWMYAGTSMSVTSTVHTMEYVRQLLYSAGYQQINLDTHGYSASESTIQSRINAGVGIWNHRPAWVGEVYCSHVDELSNGYMNPLCLNLSCGTGDFVSSDDVSECLLAQGSELQPQGAIAAIATATSGTHTQPNNIFDGSFFHALITLGQYNVGDALAIGKAHFLWQSIGWSGPHESYEYCYWNNLMGDPSTEIWTDTPEVISADYPSSISIGTNMVTISVEDASLLPLEGAYVHIYKANETMVGGLTDATGEVSLPITATTADSLFITVSGHNLKPVVGYALVQSSPRNVAPVSVAIDDDNSGYSQGNNNGEANPGEALEINVTLKNWGTSSANGVSATISTSDPYVASMGNTTVSYGNISGGSQVTPTDDFEVTLASTIPHGYDIQLELEITDMNRTIYTSLVVLSIEEIDLEYDSHAWVNAGNGIFDAGEIVNLQVTLENVGQVDAPSGITATVAVDNPAITILDATGTYPAINQGATGTNSTNRFQLQADTTLFNGTPFEVTLYLENASGFRDTVVFQDTIGTVVVTDPMGPDAYGYYAFDNEDLFYNKAPSYSWVDIDPGHQGSGTLLSLPDYGENQDVSVYVPLTFTVNYYGQTYSGITVCSNGWLAFGDQSDLAHAQNWRIPGALGALSQVSALWDDFRCYSSGDGRVWKYYDPSDHLFIIEWSRVYNLGSGDRETFQVIIYDENYYPTPTNDAEIRVQYMYVTNGDNYDNYASVGIDNQDQSIGLEYTFNNQYPPAAAALTNGRAILFTTDPGTLIDPPNIIVNPLSVTGFAAPGDSTEQYVTVSNTGASNLNYSISIFYVSDGGLDNPILPFTPLVRRDYIDYSSKNPFTVDISDQGQSGGGQLDNSGGPDNFGYVWIDSDEPGGPVYSWVEIATIGTNTGITGDDQNVGPFGLGFTMEFYGQNYNSIRVCSNGWMSFTSTLTTYSNRTIPYASNPNALLAPFWDDLYPPGSGDIYYYQDTANQRFIMQFDNMDHIGIGGPYTFEAILYANGRIVFQYQNLVTYLTSCTVGIEDHNGTDGLQVAYNQAYLHNNMAIEFAMPGQWLEVTPLFGTVEPGNSDELTFKMNAVELDTGTYEANVTISNNDPNNSQVVVPVTFIVSDAPSAPPEFVDNFVIQKVGDHSVLTWSPVTEDTSGFPITVSRYNIYLDTVPDFTPGPGNFHDSTPDTTYMHVNAIQSNVKLFYVVTAEH